MTPLNPNTQKARSILESYRFALVAQLDLYGAYDRPSKAKRLAWNDCRELCEKLGGTHLCVTGHNCMTFGAAFQTKKGVVYMTRNYTYFIPQNA